MYVAANYMKSYALEPKKFAEKVKLSEKYGADMIYLVDSAGGMFPDQIKSYHSAIRNVSDINTVLKEAYRVLKPGGFMFWEVPNADCPSNGAQKGQVDVPHTYYFETNFFEKWLNLFRQVSCNM